MIAVAAMPIAIFEPLERPLLEEEETASDEEVDTVRDEGVDAF